MIAQYSFSQPINENPFFVVKNGATVFYLTTAGEVTTKTNAGYYRTVCMDKTSFGFEGNISDYYISGQKAYELSGDEVRGYYENGRPKFTGYTRNSQRDSIWTYFYDNGKIERVVEFKNNTPFLKEFYKRNGKVSFNDGNGKYFGLILLDKSLAFYSISGNVKEGKMSGQWSWSKINSTGQEFFEDGEFISGKSTDKNQPNLRVLTLFDYNLHENVEIFKFIAVPSENATAPNTVQPSGIPITLKNEYLESHIDMSSPSLTYKKLLYKNSANLGNEFSSDLKEFLISLDAVSLTKDYWCFLQFTVNNQNRIVDVVSYSNIDTISQSINKFLSESTYFQGVKDGNTAISCNVFLCIVCIDGKIFLPEYSFKSTKADLLELFR